MKPIGKPTEFVDVEAEGNSGDERQLLEMQEVHRGMMKPGTVVSSLGVSVQKQSPSEDRDNSTQEPPPKKDSVLVIVGCMNLNFWSAVGIIWCNKWLINSGFRYVNLLTWMHFVASWIGLQLTCGGCRMFVPKYVSAIQMAPLCFSFIAFVVFNNLSLQFNTVGIYQLMKVMMTPVLVVLQYVLYRMTLTPWQIIALIPICLGVGMATVSSLQVNGVLGLLFGSLGIFSTCLYQIWVKVEQKNLGLNPYQLLHNQSFVSMFLLFPLAAVIDRELVFCLFIDGNVATMGTESDSITGIDRTGTIGYSVGTVTSLLNLLFQPPASVNPLLTPGSENKCRDVRSLFFGDSMFIAGTFLSCFLAFLVNLSTFLVIGKTSPVTYQVLGHCKLFVIMGSAFVMFGDIPSSANLTGCGLAISGILWYTHLKM